MVAETSIRLILSVKTFVAVVLIPSSFADFPEQRKLGNPKMLANKPVAYLPEFAPTAHTRLCQCAGSRLPWKQAMTISVPSGSMTNISAQGKRRSRARRTLL
jgi:hypothetical protein